MSPWSEAIKSSSKTILINSNFRSHKCILSAGSDYFMKIFRSMGDKCPNPVPVPDPAPLDKFASVADDSFSTIVKFLYGA